MFAASNLTISAPTKDKRDNIESEEESEPFNEAREIERRRAPRGKSQGTPNCRAEKVAYVVFNGRKLGVFYNWYVLHAIFPPPIPDLRLFVVRAACEMSIIRFPGQRYKGYYTVEEAVDAWNHANGVGNIGPLPDVAPAGPSTYTRFNHIISNEEAYWAVLKGVNPGVYQGK